MMSLSRCNDDDCVELSTLVQLVMCCGDELSIRGDVVAICSALGDVLERTDDGTSGVPPVFEVCVSVVLVLDVTGVFAGGAGGDVADLGRGFSASFIGNILLAVGDDFDMTEEVPTLCLITLDALDEVPSAGYFTVVDGVPGL